MRLPDKSFVARIVSLGLVAALAGCGLAGGSRPSNNAALTPDVNGPAADYPVTIGDPYTVAGVTYTPSDTWNYDEVGYAALESAGGSTISGAHHTLPLPSYVEVTSLDTGRTILVRLERRGPMDGSAVIALSPGAAKQLGATQGTPVRVRRVNPPEPERAALREGKPASDRMDTPMSLVAVLKRKLPEEGAPPTTLAAAKPASDPEQATMPASPPAAPDAGVPALPPLDAASAPKSSIEVVTPPASVAQAPAAAPAVAEKPAVRAKPAAAPAPRLDHGYVVQAGAYSTRERAERVAKAIGGAVSKTGSSSLYRVRTGPFGSKKEAEASLAKVKAAGYSDARIYSGG